MLIMFAHTLNDHLVMRTLVEEGNEAAGHQGNEAGVKVAKFWSLFWTPWRGYGTVSLGHCIHSLSFLLF